MITICLIFLMFLSFHSNNIHSPIRYTRGTSQRYDIPGYELVVPVEGLAALVDLLTDAGATEVSDQAALTARRVELGRPTAAHELTDAYSPLESGLAWTCAENKGCCNYEKF